MTSSQANHSLNHLHQMQTQVTYNNKKGMMRSSQAKSLNHLQIDKTWSQKIKKE